MFGQTDSAGRAQSLLEALGSGDPLTVLAAKDHLRVEDNPFTLAVTAIKYVKVDDGILDDIARRFWDNEHLICAILGAAYHQRVELDPGLGSDLHAHASCLVRLMALDYATKMGQPPPHSATILSYLRSEAKQISFDTPTDTPRMVGSIAEFRQVAKRIHRRLRREALLPSSRG